MIGASLTGRPVRSGGLGVTGGDTGQVLAVDLVVVRAVFQVPDDMRDGQTGVTCYST